MKRKLTLSMCLLLIISTMTFAQWTQMNGPHGVSGHEIIKVGDVLLISATWSYGGVYRSTDNGKSWVRSNEGLPSTPSLLSLETEDGKIYASGNGDGLYMSSDTGKTWSTIDIGIANLSFNPLLVIGDSIFAGSTTGGVYLSPDHGETWTDISNGITNPIHDFVQFDDKIYAINDKLYVTSDHGDNWDEITIPGFSSNGSASMTVSDSVIFATGYSSVYVSKDTAKTWELAKMDSWNTNYKLRRQGDTIYYHTSDNRIFLTIDNGETSDTMQIPGLEGLMNDAIFLDEKIIAVASKGIYESIDGGENWTNIDDRGFLSIGIRSFVQNDQYIFTGTNEFGMFRSDNGGSSWEEINIGLNTAASRRISDVIIVGDEIFIATDDDLFSSSNNGDTWESKYDPGMWGPPVQAVGFDNGTLVIAVRDEGTYYSQDTAKTWHTTKLDGLSTSVNYKHLDVSGDTIIVSSTNGIFLTAGVTEPWVDISDDNTFFSNKVIKLDTMLVAAGYEGLYVSKDWGQLWENITVDSDIKDFYPVDFLIDGDKIYFTINQKIYYTAFDYDNILTSDAPQLGFTKFFISNENILMGTAYNSVWRNSIDNLNLPPVIKGHLGTLEIPEDDSILLNLNDFIIFDPDNTAVEEFSINNQSGGNYKIHNSYVIPSKNYEGELLIPLIINDGIDASEPYEIRVTVTPVNDLPQPTLKEAISFEEDTPFMLGIEHFNITDPDNEYPNDFSITVQEGDSYSMKEGHIVPDENFTGTLTVPVIISDGTDDSPVVNVSIEVKEVNDIPDISLKVTQSTEEDTPLNISLDDFHITDPDNAYPEDFTLIIEAGENYTAEDGQITPTQDFYGSINVPVKVSDGTDESETLEISIEITPVNDIPVIENIQGVFSTPENATIAIPLDSISVSDPDNAYPTDFTVSISDGENYTVSGNEVTPVSGFTGTILLPVMVSDGSATSNEYELSLQVTPITSVNVLSLNKSVNIFPNPGNGHLNLSFTQDTKNITDVKVYDVPGNVVYEQSGTFNTNIQIDLTNEPNGIYFLTVSSNENIMITKKIIKK